MATNSDTPKAPATAPKATKETKEVVKASKGRGDTTAVTRTRSNGTVTVSYMGMKK